MQFSQANMGADRVSLVQNANGVEFTVDHSVQYLPDPQGLGRRTFEGWASVRGIDFQGENTPPEAFVGALHRYLKKNPVLLWHHNFSKPIGRILSARIDYRKGIYVVGEVFRSDNPAYAQWPAAQSVRACRVDAVLTFAPVPHQGRPESPRSGEPVPSLCL